MFHMTMTVEDSPCFSFLLRSKTGTTLRVRRDTDFVLLGQAFGWPGTDDGTPESRSKAFDFLSSRVGESTDDPGYF
jgi:hypothetical protein